MAWTCSYGTTSKRQNAAWLRPEDQRHQISKLGFQSKKRLFLIVFDCKGPMTVAVLTEKSTTTGIHYIEIILAKVVEEMQNHHPNTSTLNVLMHHNASPHKKRALIQYLDNKQV